MDKRDKGAVDLNNFIDRVSAEIENINYYNKY